MKPSSPPRAATRALPLLALAFVGASCSSGAPSREPPLADAAAPPPSAAAAPGSAGRGAAEAPGARLPTCAPAEFRARANLYAARLDEAGGALTWCASREIPGARPAPAREGARCWRADLESGAVTPVEPALPDAPNAPPPAGPAPFALRPGPASVEVCDGKGGCRAVQLKGEYRKRAAGGSQQISASVSEDGQLVSVIHIDRPDDEQPDTSIETYEVGTGKRVGRFEVRVKDRRVSVNEVAFLGDSLLVTDCEMGPSCASRLVDPRTGKVVGEIPVDTYRGRRAHVDGDLWAFVSADATTLARVHAKDGRAEESVRLGGAVDFASDVAVLRRPAGDLVILRGGGSREGDLDNVVVVDAAGGKVRRKISVAECPTP